MRAILVDDEPLALEHLAEELGSISGWDIIGTFQDPVQALGHILKLQPQVLFLDIEMPEMSGIQLAEVVREQLPELFIVFVTVYEEYAVKAFELYAQDYVLKPIYRDRLIKLTERLQHCMRYIAPALPAEAPVLQLFRSFQLERRDAAPQALKWKTFKAQELFLYLLHHRGRLMPKQVIIEQLWPETEWKKGTTQLYTAVYQIRKLMQDEQLPVQILNSEEGYRLDPGGMELDVDIWEKRLREAPALTRNTLPQHLSICEMYTGDYLSRYGYAWAEPERHRLRHKWLQHVKNIAGWYQEQEALEAAAELYRRAQGILPEEELFYHELMLIYARLKDRFSVEHQYRQLQDMLEEQFDAAPREEIQTWFRSWSRSQDRSLD
ncbi:response regulator [Paenibacillus sp. JSM ZJ436]|uniref:response regulator n=1 Tax=Paenibacillus sp. JSM ZJ436 TaxID=3376190 RepID=UPI0037922C1A